MFVLFHLEPINGQFRLYPSLPGVEGAQGISAGGPEGRLAAPRKNSLYGFESTSITAWIS